MMRFSTGSIFEKVCEERGYTLLETLVAMGLFLSVLLPLGVTVGNLTVDGSVNQLTAGLRAGQTELGRVITERDFTDGTRTIGRAFVIERAVRRSGRLVDITIRVMEARHSSKRLATLHKSILDP